LASFCCPKCGSISLFRDGFRRLGSGRQVQRWFCRECAYRFSNNPYKDCQTNNNHQLCVIKEAKKLDSTTKSKIVVGEKEKIEFEVKGKVVEYCFHMTKQGYSEHTIRLHRSILRVLKNRGANLFDIESVKEVIARQKQWSGHRKRNVINAYTSFLKFRGLNWEKPRYKIINKFPFIPTEQEIDSLISGAGKKLSTFLLLLKETAMRRGEAKRLEWVDVDFERNTIAMNNPEKGSNPRMWRANNSLIAMLKALPNNDQKVFGSSSISSMKSMFQTLRKRLSTKLQNPRLRRITFHTLRHWKATTLYHKTKDIFYVKQFLGHKSIKNTEIYINIERSLFDQGNDEFTVKIVQTPEEIKEYLEVGYEYVCQKDKLIFMRKRK